MSSAARAQDFQLKIIALNDLHGNLESPGQFRANMQSPRVPVGGVDYLAGYVAQLKSENPTNIVVSAGDLTGASPLVSGLFHDEGTIEAMNRVGLELNAVGNHEFDNGMQELRRKQRGGCSSVDRNTCEGARVGTPVPFEGAKYQYLAANVVDAATGKAIFPAYAIKAYKGVKVAFIGVTLKETPTIVITKNVAGLRFTDEADAINRVVRQLRARGVKIFVVLIHQGGMQTGKDAADINTCDGGLNGYPILGMVKRLDDGVSLVLSAHTHVAYVCELPNSVGRNVTVTSASAFGRMLTDVDMTIDPRSGTATHVTARNLLVDRTNKAIRPDATIAGIIAKYAELAAPIVNRVVGSITTEVKKAVTAAGENEIGDLIADAQLEATRGEHAVVAFTNESGVRTGLSFASGAPGVEAGRVTYGELVAAQPFGNDLVTMTMTGEQLRVMLEEQFKGCALGAQPGEGDPPTETRMLEPSAGFSYTWHQDAPVCRKVDAGSIRLNGAVVVPTAKYRVTVNSLLADGGAQFYVLRRGTERVVGEHDVEAMTAYFAKHSPVSPPKVGRIAVE